MIINKDGYVEYYDLEGFKHVVTQEQYKREVENFNKMRDMLMPKLDTSIKCVPILFGTGGDMEDSDTDNNFFEKFWKGSRT